MYQIDVWICNFMVTYVWVSQPSHLPGMTSVIPHVSPWVTPLGSNQNMSGWPMLVLNMSLPLSNIWLHWSQEKSFQSKLWYVPNKICFFINFAANRRSQNRVDVPTMVQYQFWDTVICSLLKHMREKVAHVMAVCQILTWKITFGSTSW